MSIVATLSSNVSRAVSKGLDSSRPKTFGLSPVHEKWLSKMHSLSNRFGCEFYKCSGSVILELIAHSSDALPVDLKTSFPWLVACRRRRDKKVLGWIWDILSIQKNGLYCCKLSDSFFENQYFFSNHRDSVRIFLWHWVQGLEVPISNWVKKLLTYWGLWPVHSLEVESPPTPTGMDSVQHQIWRKKISSSRWGSLWN